MILFSALFKLKKVQKMYLAYNSTPNLLAHLAGHKWPTGATKETKKPCPSKLVLSDSTFSIGITDESSHREQ